MAGLKDVRTAETLCLEGILINRLTCNSTNSIRATDSFTNDSTVLVARVDESDCEACIRVEARTRARSIDVPKTDYLGSYFSLFGPK